ncbi:MAG: hypoxanthine phosphoribosyltransferase [Clostridia bacterium]|nr:hypoxanthine phosphoribosyltransferase [Clostridia bacterium]
MIKDVKSILLNEKELDEITSTLAKKIENDYQDKNLLLLGILKGSVVFMSDLMKKINLPMQIDFMKVSSYGAGTKTTGKINIMLDLHRNDLSKLDILIIEDIIDSGRTLSYLSEYLRLAGAKSVKTVTLLDKPSRREVEFTPDYCGTTIPDEFVVGYGLDYAENYRTLPYVAILKPRVYKSK